MPAKCERGMEERDAVESYRSRTQVARSHDASLMYLLPIFQLFSAKKSSFERLSRRKQVCDNSSDIGDICDINIGCILKVRQCGSF